METVISCVFFVFESRQTENKHGASVFNKLLTNLASSSRTGEHWPSVVFVRTSLLSVHTATTSGQYSPVRPLRSFSKRLVLAISYTSHKLKYHSKTPTYSYHRAESKKFSFKLLSFICIQHILKKKKQFLMR